MKAVVSNRIYLEIAPEIFQGLDNALTYKIDRYKRDAPPEIIKNLRKINSSLVSLPSGRFDLIPDGYEIKDKRILVPAEFPEFRGTLRPSQQEVYDQLEDCSIINAPVSWGKTFTGLACAQKLGQKTLVVTHKIFLRDQWEKQVKEVFGVPAGVIGSGRFETDSPVVVGNVQTLYNVKEKLSKMFGTVIVDECHHTPANTFNRIVDSSYARYKIGLSATLRRKDGKHVILQDYFGHNKFIPPKENQMTPSIDIIQTDIRFMDGGRIPWATRVNDLVSNDEYGKLVCLLAASYRQKGHKVLLLSDRVGFLKRVKKTLGSYCEIITGEDKEDSRESKLQKVQKGEVDILLGTQSIFSEGISINPLGCLILGAPVSNEPLLDQLIGRVIRKHPGKIDPVIVDINLKGKTAENQAKTRLGFYMQEGYKTNFIKV